MVKQVKKGEKNTVFASGKSDAIKKKAVKKAVPAPQDNRQTNMLCFNAEEINFEIDMFCRRNAKLFSGNIPVETIQILAQLELGKLIQKEIASAWESGEFKNEFNERMKYWSESQH